MYYRIVMRKINNMEKGQGLLNNIPVVTRNLLIINILVFIADQLLSKDGVMTKYLALHFVLSKDFMPHQIITYMFMHANLSHIFFNMFALYMFGRTLETVWGPKRFLSYFLITGIGAALLQLLILYIRYTTLLNDLPANEIVGLLDMLETKGASLLSSNMNFSDPIVGALNEIVNIPMVGASGAIFGILVGFGMLFPNSELFIIPIPFPIKAKYFVIGYGALELILGFSNNAGDNVAHFAHLGGLITGFFILLYWKKKGTLHGNFHR